MKSFFLLILTFMTRIPIPIKFEFNEKDFAKGLLLMPIVGLIIGGFLWLYTSFTPIEHSGVSAFILIFIYLAVAGGLHLDGLGDYVDGMFSGRTRERILEIMKDVHMGTFGVAALIVYFIGLFVGFSEATPMMVLLMPVVGKFMGVVACSFGHYPREKGMGMALVDYGKPWMAIMWCLVIAAVTYVVGLPFLIAFGIVLILISIVIFRTTQVLVA